MSKNFIYIVSPLGAVGGGMFRVADYLARYQKDNGLSPELRMLDSRGQKLIFSPFVLLVAVFKILLFRSIGRLSGLHINVAERLSILRKGVIVLVGRLLGLPVLLHLHAAQIHTSYASSSFFGKLFTRFVFARASICVVLGSRAKLFLMEELGIPESKIFVLVNGVPVGPRLERDKDDSRFRLLFLGNLTERKGVSDFLRALSHKEMKGVNWRATLAGGGDIEFYKRLAVDLGIEDRLDFLGWIDQGRAAQLMANSDVLVLPSYDEGLPLVILEALGRGLPVVCTPVGEIPEFLKNGINAIFVKPGDPNSLAEAIMKLEASFDVRNELARNGLIAYEEMFSIDVFFSSLMKIYRNVFI